MKYIFSDFDGTLTDHDQLSPIFFDILNLVKDYSIPLIIVTGRSKSWAHFLLTHFNYLDEVISEGGGVLTTRNNIDYEDIVLIDDKEIKHLEKFTIKLLSKFQNLRLTTDSFGRYSDRAIDLKLLKELNLDNEVESFMKINNINYSRSSVHLNFWSGEVSKAKAVSAFINENNIKMENCIYFGDAKNDESMFKYFENTVGVSNIKNVLNKMSFHPKVILTGNENRGPYGVYNFLKKRVLELL